MAERSHSCVTVRVHGWVARTFSVTFVAFPNVYLLIFYPSTIYSEEGGLSKELRWVNVPVVDNAVCADERWAVFLRYRMPRCFLQDINLEVLVSHP